MKIKENRVWNMYDVRTACIKNDLYTRGDNQDYEAMLNFVATHKPTTDNIYKVACDIYEHSTDQTVSNIMFILANDCMNICYEIKRA